MLHETNGANSAREAAQVTSAPERESESERERGEMGEKTASVFKRGDVTWIIKEAG